MKALNRLKDKEDDKMEKRRRGIGEQYINPIGLRCIIFSHAYGSLKRYRLSNDSHTEYEKKYALR